MPTSDRLKAVRERLSESQEQFARRFGVDQSTIHRWESEGVPTRGPAAIAIDLVLANIESPRTTETATS